MNRKIKDNAGALFKNTNKDSENHPDYRGQARIDGHDCWVSAWIKISKAGEKYMSLSFKRKTARRSGPNAMTNP